jgi:hypothetical protein
MGQPSGSNRVNDVQERALRIKLRNHHIAEWSSGARGGGKVPVDFGWSTNPKQWQEENGSGLPKK